jgi:glycosyltransferase involved in cell wall biosynthesis
MAGFERGEETDAAYAEWVHAHDTLRAEDLAAIATMLPGLPSRPLISLLLPLGFERFAPLRQTVAALRAQLYPHWELCVAGQPDAGATLAELQGLGARLAYPKARLQPDVAAAANAALEAARGDYVAVLSVGDILPPHTLFEIALELARHPEADLIYTDEDAIDAAGARHTPRFKQGWDPDLLLGHDCVGGLAVWRREVLARAGGLRPGFGRAALYDLALRATEMIAPDRIRHLPAVLLHRPMDRGQARQEMLFGAAPVEARKAVAERLPPGARLAPAPLWPAANRIVWPLPEPPPLASVILAATGSRWRLLTAAYGVLYRTDYWACELLVAHDGRGDAELRAALDDLAQRPRVRLVEAPTARSLPALRNAAAAVARGAVLVMLDDGIEVIEPGWLGELVAQARRPGVGAVGALLTGPDGRVRHAGYTLEPDGAVASPAWGLARGERGAWGQAAVVRGCAAVSGAALALPRQAFADAGGFDAWHYPVAGADIDLCLRLSEAGWRVLTTPFAELLHLNPIEPPDTARIERQQKLLWQGWRHRFANDAHHHPSLACRPDGPLCLAPPRRPRPWQRAA